MLGIKWFKNCNYYKVRGWLEKHGFSKTSNFGYYNADKTKGWQEFDNGTETITLKCTIVVNGKGNLLCGMVYDYTNEIYDSLNISYDMNHKILEAVLTGIIQALADLDDEEVHVGRTGNIQSGKIGELQTLKEYYSKKLQEMRPNPLEIDKSFIDQAIEWHELYGALYSILTGMPLKDFIWRCMSLYGNDVNLNWLDTSNITNMNGVFASTYFNGDISEWDVSNVTNMQNMFKHADSFVQDVSKWDVSKVKFRAGSFIYCPIKDEYIPKFK